MEEILKECKDDSLGILGRIFENFEEIFEGIFGETLQENYKGHCDFATIS